MRDSHVYRYDCLEIVLSVEPARPLVFSYNFEQIDSTAPALTHIQRTTDARPVSLDLMHRVRALA